MWIKLRNKKVDIFRDTEKVRTFSEETRIREVVEWIRENYPDVPIVMNTRT